MVLGGDGFMLHVLHSMIDTGRVIPAYGMNRGTVGFLMNRYDKRGSVMDRLNVARGKTITPLRIVATTQDGAKHHMCAINELSLLRETDHGWAKLASWYRPSDQGPPWDDMPPLARALIEARPERIVWGTNWPHPILWDHPMPNDTDLLDQFMGWCGDEATRKQILVDNPAQLYGFE